MVGMKLLLPESTEESPNTIIAGTLHAEKCTKSKTSLIKRSHGAYPFPILRIGVIKLMLLQKGSIYAECRHTRGVVKDTSAIYGRRFCGICSAFVCSCYSLKGMNNKKYRPKIN